MRVTVALTILVAGVLSACAATTSAPPRLSYAPPTEPPAEPSPAYVGQSADLIWNQLLDRLIQASFQVDLADPERGIVVASYSGDPEPYVTCGSILVNRGGDVEEVPASGQASFRRVVQGRGLDVTRGIKLDARLVVQVKPEAGGAGVETTSNYVLTKTIVAADGAGRARGRAHEVVSFSAGGRGEFSKGTVCQPNGALERIVLGVLPSMARLEPPARDQPAPEARTAGSPARAPSIQITETPGPSPAGQMAETSGPALTAQSEQSSAPGSAEQATSLSEVPDADGAPASGAEVPGVPGADIAEVRDAALPEPASREDRHASLDCPIPDKIFCEILDVTGPYRRANQEQNLGLALDAIEGGNPLVSGSALGFDVSLPSYDAYLTVSFFLKDGTVHHVLSGSDRRWPADAREFVGDAGLSADDRGSVELVVALASDVPVFASPRPSSETAELYLSDLRKRLFELSNGGAPAQIAASLLVVTPA